MRDVGGLVWIAFVLFAVISSIVRSARRARAVPATRKPAVTTQFQSQAQVVAPPRPAPPLPVASVPPAPPPVPAAQMAPSLDVPPPAAKRFFAGRGALIRGIVAAEVLGKPLALRDE